MSVVRLELDIPDEAADALAEELHERYVRISALPEGWRAATVQVIPDEVIQRERVILRALEYFLPPEQAH